MKKKNLTKIAHTSFKHQAANNLQFNYAASWFRITWNIPNMLFAYLKKNVTFELKKDIRNKKLFVYKDFGFIVLSSRLFIINITLESKTPAYYLEPEDNLMTRGGSWICFIYVAFDITSEFLIRTLWNLFQNVCRTFSLLVSRSSSLNRICGSDFINSNNTRSITQSFFCCINIFTKKLHERSYGIVLRGAGVVDMTEYYPASKLLKMFFEFLRFFFDCKI